MKTKMQIKYVSNQNANVISKQARRCRIKYMIITRLNCNILYNPNTFTSKRPFLHRQVSEIIIIDGVVLWPFSKSEKAIDRINSQLSEPGAPPNINEEVQRTVQRFQ